LKWREENPEKEKPSYFKTAGEISPEDHIKMLILFSKYIDSAVSKTVNLPNSATVGDVKKAFLLAMENGVKGITVFRDGSKEGVLVKHKKEPIPLHKKEEPEKIETKQNILETIKAERRGRGNRLIGATTRVKMQDHNLYITVNKNFRGDIEEIFSTVGENKHKNSGQTSGVEDAWAEALGKTLSLALRAGVNIKAIIRNLKNIPSDKPVFTTIGECQISEVIPSPPHAIARVVEEEIKYLYPNPLKKGDIVDEQKVLRCKNCSSTNVTPLSPTCYLCKDCGKQGCQGEA